MLLLIPLLPFLGFVVNAAVGRRLSKTVSGAVACGVMVASFAVAATATWPLLFGHGAPVEQIVYRWIEVGDLDVSFALRLDQLATVMVLVVTGIGALIHIYSIGYMHEETDSEYARYFSYLNLFASFMLVLVLAANFVVMFVGWEGVGLCSYLLIGFWFQKPSAAEAGKKAFIVNRVGDFGFLLGVLLIFAHFGTLDFQQLAGLVAPMPREVAGGTLTLITLLLFVGATGKSAQIPLYIWLPDAMEGPTPVSALIHAATMVTAGVYMIGRNAVLFGHAPETLAVVAVVGAVTALMAGTIGLVQNDIKRVLAYSTVSQLGYMFLAMGAGAWAAGIFHLMTHAFFKALLFLGSGAVIHALAGEQDMRKMGGLKRELPVTYWTFLAATLAISGVPLFSGFFSKDEILFRTYTAGFPILWGIGVATALLTAVYMFRLVFLTFHGERAAEAGGHGGHGGHHHLHDAPPSMAVPLILLAIGSVLAGYVGVPHVLGGENRIERFLEPSFEAHGPVTALHEVRAPEPIEAPPEAPAEGAAVPASTEYGLMAISTVLALAGIGIAAFFFLKRRDAADAAARRFAGLHRLLLHKYYVDELYDATIVQPIKRLSTGVLWKVVDAGVIDGTVNGAGITVRAGAGLLRRLQTGSVRVSAAALFMGVVVIVGYYLWP